MRGVVPREVFRGGGVVASGVPNGRMAGVDAARGLGIVLMYYGHVLQRGIDPSNAAAASELRFLYAFHLPLFFVISGLFFVAAPRLGERLGTLALSRLVPVGVFTLAFLPLWAVHLGGFSPTPGTEARAMLEDYLVGRPALNWVTWFLVCLFVCEALAALVLSRIARRRHALLLGIACIVGGSVWSDHSREAAAGLAYLVGRFWFLSEAVVGLGFYAIGWAIAPAVRRWLVRPTVAGPMAVAGMVAAFALHGLNRDAAGPVTVMLSARRHGEPVVFLATALAGSLGALALGMCAARIRWLAAIGRRALAFLVVNGVFYQYLLPKAVQWWPVADAPGAVLGAATAMTVACLLLAAPVVGALTRHLPQLVGHAGEEGPWLPSLHRVFRLAADGRRPPNAAGSPPGASTPAAGRGRDPV